MKKLQNALLVGLLTCLWISLPIFGAPISQQAAMLEAQSFLLSRGRTSVMPNSLTLAPSRSRVRTDSQAQASPAQSPYYYVFNLSGDSGFVVVSGDDRVAPILGYADVGAIDPEDCPDGLLFMLDCYAEELARIDMQPEGESVQPALSPVRDVTSKQRIAPLLQTRWNQGEPYNNNCPEIKDNNDVVIGRAVTGCVATAMAQVMYYHRKPTTVCTTISGYTARNNLSTQAELNGTTFAWDDMTLTYGSAGSDAAKTAVATLMQYCGWSLQMNYNVSSAGGSSAYNESITEALKTYFGYDSGIENVERKHYTYTDWIELIYNELAVGRPVILGGQSAGGGHSFVCDGYDSNDLFHINWGWGGSSNGYFRLALLNPYEQGIGGSSTLDGFSFSQDAVIGICPDCSSGKAFCLALEGLTFGAADNDVSKTFTRTDATAAFTGINLYASLCSFRFGSNSFDYAVQLIDGNGAVTHTLTEVTGGSSISFNTTLNASLSGLSIPADVADGTYHIKVVSRPNGTSAWQDCYYEPHSRMTATISDNTLTIHRPAPASVPTCNSITVSGNLHAGYEQTVNVSLTGGATAFHDNLYLYVDGTPVMGRQADIPAGETVTVRFSFTPVSAGEKTLRVTRARSTNDAYVLLSTTVTVETSDASNTQTLTITPTVSNLNESQQLYGGGLMVTVNIANTDAYHDFVSSLACSLREYDAANTGIDSYVNATAYSKNIVVGKSSSINLDFAYTGLTVGKYYRLRISYVQGYEEGDETKTRRAEVFYPTANANPMEMTAGYILYASDGTFTLHPASESITSSERACIDLRTMSNFDGFNITPSTNPNCLYLLAESAEVPGVLSGKNVVKNAHATTISLTDGHDFFSPIAFTADDISYTRTFTLAAGGTTGWNTLFLPFAPTTITCDGSAVDWFRSATDSGKNFWIRTFSADAAGTVYFDYPSSLEAYTPYIIAVPDNRWGAAWQMTNKAVVFSATNAYIQPTEQVSCSGSYFNMVGNTVSTTASNVYMLNSEGSRFVLSSASTTMDAFRAWFVPTAISSLSLPQLTIGSGAPTLLFATPDNQAATTDTGWFTLDGRRLGTQPTQRGLYIHNGQKCFIP